MPKINSMKRKNPKVLAAYHHIIKTQAEDKIIEPCDDITEGGKPKHYLPHHGVVYPKKINTPSWVRVVYNGSFKKTKDDPSVNECLRKGPSLNPLIIEILIRFRTHPVAFVCDIKKAFLQIMIREEDRDFLRFLWVDDPFSETPRSVSYRFYRVHVFFL